MPEFEPQQVRSEAAAGPAGGVLMARALRENGVDTLFALCGGHILGLLDACLDENIRVVDHRHEGAASLAAEGWALATGRTGVATVTAGPGFGNAMTGLMDAGMGNVPSVLIAGRTGLGQYGRGAVMDIDQRAIATPATKWAATCYETHRIPGYIAEALHRARAGCPGSVYLEVPQDVFMANAAQTEPAAPVGFGAPGSPAPDPAALERALDALARAERPIVIAGSGAFFSGATEDLLAFVEATGIPVTTTSGARGLLPDPHAACLGSMVHGGLAVSQSDVVLILGSAFNANMLYGRPPLFGTGQTVIQVDIDATRLGGQRRPDVSIAGDVAVVLRALTAGWNGPSERGAWVEQAQGFASFGRASWDHQVDNHAGSKLHAGAVARDLAEFARETGPHTFVADGGDALTWGLAFAEVNGPGRLLSTTTALGTLGVGLPFSIAAAAARPDEPVFCFIGDGSFGLCAMEVDTAVRHGLPIITVVSNNGGWRDVSHEQDAWFGPGRTIASELGDSRYELIAEAFGGHGEVVSELDELRPALKRCLDAGVASVINVRTDPAVLSELLRNMGALGLM